jgi:hypothetical protein
MVWLACAAFTLLAGIYVLLPLFRELKDSPDIAHAAETDLDRLLDRKTIIYGNLRDLEFEYKMGRLSDSDFKQLEAGYKNEAAVILQKLDSLGASGKLNEVIKKDIAPGKAKQPASGMKPKHGARCPSCGSEVFEGKKFCADCGHKL